MADTTTRRRLPIPAIAACVLLGVVATFVTYQFTKDGSGDGADPLVLEDLDDTDPAFYSAEVLTFDDGSTSLRELLDGRPTVLNFFASTCGPCIAEMPALEAAHQALGDEVAFLGLAVVDRPDDARDLIERTGVTYVTARDQAGDVLAALGSTVMPTTAFLGADGRVIDVHAGALDEDEVLAMIADALGATPADG